MQFGLFIITVVCVCVCVWTAGGVQRPATPVMSQADVENVKKCKNFFSTLLRLASQQPPETLNTVKKLIQNLVVRWAAFWFWPMQVKFKNLTVFVIFCTILIFFPNSLISIKLPNIHIFIVMPDCWILHHKFYFYLLLYFNKFCFDEVGWI